MKFIKKYKNKLLIMTLSFMFALFMMLNNNKTYAYTTNQLSYTINENSYTNYLNTINNVEGIDLQAQKSINLITTQQTKGTGYILINYNWVDEQLQFANYANNEINIYIQMYYTDNTRYNNNNQEAFKQSTTEYNYIGYNTLIIKLTGDANKTINNISFYFRTYYAYMNRILIRNIDIVNTNDIGIQQYYDTYYGAIEQNYLQLQQDYNTLENNYNTLNNSYMDLQINYNTLLNNYNQLQSNYTNLDEDYIELQQNMQQLETQYNNLVEQYNNMQPNTTTMYEALNGATAKLYNYDNDNLIMTETITINEGTKVFDNTCIPQITNYMNNYTTDNDDPDSANYPSAYVYMILELNTYVNKSLLFVFNNTVLQTNVTLYNTKNNQSETYDNQDATSQLNHYEIVVNTNYMSFNKIKYESFYMPDYINITFNISMDGFTYQQGYQKGVDSLQNQITTLNVTIQEKNRTIATLQAQNNDLTTRYNNISNNPNTLYGMVIGIADVPLTVFKNIFDFNILGINIAETVLGIISLLVIIWLIKRLIK